MTGAAGLLVKQTLDARLEMFNLANTVGVTAPTFGALAHAAEMAGKSSDQLVGGLMAMNAAAFDAANQNVEAAKKFEDLEVSVTDSNKELRNSEDIFRDVIDALGKIDNEAERAATAQKIFGESAGALRAALGDLSTEGFEAAEERARAFTKGLTDEGIAAAMQYELAMTKLDIVLRAFGDVISDQAGPALNVLADGLVMLSTFVSTVVTETFTIFGERIFVVFEAVKGLGKVLEEVAQGNFRKAAEVLNEQAEASRKLQEQLDLTVPVVGDLARVFEKATTNAQEMRDKVNASVTATGGLSEAEETLADKAKAAEERLAALTAELKKLKSGAQESKDSVDELNAEMDDFVQNLEYAAGSTAQAIDPLNEEMQEFFATLEYGAGSTAQVITPLDEMRTAFEKALPAVEQFGAGFEDVMGLVSDLAGAFADTGVAAEDMTDKQKMAALQAFQVQKAAALATAVVNTAVGMTQALAGAPPPLSFINAALVAASGGLSIAEIASQQPPSFAVGGVMPSTGGAAILHPGEGVLSAGAVDSLGGVSALDSLNSRSAMASGGAVVVQWKHLRQSFAYEARDAGNRPGPLRDIRRDGRRAGQMRRAVRADYGSL